MNLQPVTIDNNRPSGHKTIVWNSATISEII